MDVSDVFCFFFFLLGLGEGGARGAGKGGGNGFLLKSQEGVGLLSGWGGGGREARKGVCEELGGGGGPNFFFRGRNSHQGKTVCFGLVIRRPPDYSSNLCPPKTFAI